MPRKRLPEKRREVKSVKLNDKRYGSSSCLEVRIDGRWQSYQDVSQTEDFSVDETRLISIIMLTYNARSLIDINRRLNFSSIIGLKIYDVLCLSEPWLVPEIQNQALFPNYSIYRIGLPRIWKQSTVVLTAIRNSINHEIIDLHLELDRYAVVKLLIRTFTIFVYSHRQNVAPISSAVAILQIY